MAIVNKKVTAFITTVVLLLSIAGLGSLAWFKNQSYSGIIDFLILKLSRPDLKSLITESLFPVTLYDTLQSLLWVMCVLIVLMTVICILKRNVLAAWILFASLTFKKAVINVFTYYSGLSSKEKFLFYFFTCSALILSCFRIANRDITYDEAWNYNYFISKPVYFSFLLFNTYPLYHSMAHIFNYLPFDDTINIRLPAVFSGICLLILFFYLLQKNFSKAVSFITVLLLIVSPFYTIYSSISKGVITSALFSLVIFYSVLQVTENNKPKQYFFLFTVAGFLNILCMPATAIFIIAAAIFLVLDFTFKKNVRRVLQSILASVYVLVAAIPFYITTLISTGRDAILKTGTNEFTLNTVYERVKRIFIITSRSFFYYHSITLALLVLSVILLFVLKNKYLKKQILFSLCIAFVTALFFIFNKEELPDRAISFLFIPAVFMIAVLLDYLYSINLFSKVHAAFAVAATTALLIAGYYNTYRFLHPPLYQKEDKIISDVLLQNHVTTSYVNNESFFIHYPIIQYYYNRQGLSWVMNTPETNSTRFKKFDMKDDYDCIITGINYPADQLPGYRNIFKGSDFIIFIKDKE